MENHGKNNHEPLQVKSFVADIIKKGAFAKIRFVKKIPLPAVIAGGIVILLIVVGIVILQNKKTSSSNLQTISQSAQETARNPAVGKSTQTATTFTVLPAGTVCSLGSIFSFRLDSSYRLLQQGAHGVSAITDGGLLVIVSMGDSDTKSLLESFLHEKGIAYTKTGEEFTYQLDTKTEKVQSGIFSAISVSKGNFVISVFYQAENKSKAQDTLKSVMDSMKGGCVGA